MRRRRIDLTFTALLLPLDVLGLYAAGVSAYLLRFSRFVTEVRPVLQNIPFTDYLKTVSIFVLVWLALFVLAGLYGARPRRAWNELGRIALACTAGTMVLISTVFFQREFTTSRFIVLAVWIFSFVFVLLGRLLLRTIRHLLLKYHIGHLGLVIIGHGPAADGLRNEYVTKPILGYTVVKQFANWNKDTRRALEKLRKAGSIDVVLLAEPDIKKEDALDLIAYTEEQHIAFHYLADLFAARFSNIDISTGAGVPIVEVKRTRLDGWGRIAKRIFDIVVSSCLLILFSPIMAVAAIMIVIESRGGVFFSHLPDGSPVTRIGERGVPFPYFKFRSMKEDQHWMRYGELSHLNTRKGDPLVKTKNDPRVTRVGSFIRRWSIDELPELFMVLRGDMSLVGPRPHYPEEVADYQPHHRRVLTIKPGITGMAQISGRSDLNFEDEVRLDTWYIENWSPALDLYILLKTPFAVLDGKGAT